MRKKIIIGFAAAAVVVGGVAAMSAFEAHVINVTAKIENALSVTPDEIMFGTVFPQEELYRNLNIALSQSFLAEDRVDDVSYVIKQKPKPTVYGIDQLGGVIEHARHWCYDHRNDGQLPGDYFERCYYNLCPYLSKTPDEGDNDTGVLAFHGMEEYATGNLVKSEQDTEDEWVIDLKVPCFSGMSDQDYFDWVHSINSSVASVDAHEFMLDPALESEIFGCDLWIEVTGFSVNYIDRVDIGNLEDEAVHNLVGWSDENIPGGYGGCQNGVVCTYRQVIEDLCTEDEREASFTIDVGTSPNQANMIKVRHLDGISLMDSFEIYVDNQSVGTWNDTTQQATEVWRETSFSLSGITIEDSIADVTIKAIDKIWGSCPTYGQVAIDWITVY